MLRIAVTQPFDPNVVGWLSGASLCDAGGHKGRDYISDRFASLLTPRSP
jgi:hypothetical protein